jgi:hypothetical protein
LTLEGQTFSMVLKPSTIHYFCMCALPRYPKCFRFVIKNNKVDVPTSTAFAVSSDTEGVNVTRTKGVITTDKHLELTKVSDSPTEILDFLKGTPVHARLSYYMDNGSVKIVIPGLYEGHEELVPTCACRSALSCSDDMFLWTHSAELLYERYKSALYGSEKS